MLATDFNSEQSKQATKMIIDESVYKLIEESG